MGDLVADITQYDLNLINQNPLQLGVKCEIMNSNFEVIGEIDGEIIDLSLSIDAESDTRRTGTISLIPNTNYNLDENSKIWVDKILRIYLSVYDNRGGEYKHYVLCTVKIVDGNYTYNAEENLLTINFYDLMCTLDGTISGEIGAWEYEIGYGWVLRTVMESVITQFGKIDNFIIDEMGMYKGIDYYLDWVETTYNVNSSLMNYFKMAATDARNYTSQTIIDTENIVRKSTVVDVLEKMVNTYVNFDGNRISLLNVSFTAMEEYDSAYQYSVVDGALIKTLIGTVDENKEKHEYYLFNCPDLIDYVGKMSIFIRDEYGLFHNARIVDIDGLACIYLGYEGTYEDDIITLSESVLTNKSAMCKIGNDFLELSDYYYELVDAFKYLIEVPYNIEVTSGANVLSIVSELANLYPGWEYFFDIYGKFICQMIPTCENDVAILDEETLDDFILAEDRSFQYSDVRNIIQVFGQEYDIDNFTDTCVTTNDVYIGTLDGFEEYTDGFYVAVTVDTTNTATTTLQLNELTAYGIYDTVTNNLIEAGSMIAGSTYVLKYSSLNKWYLLGQYRPMALIKLVSNEPTDEERAADISEYNCSNIQYQVNPDSPFTIEKIGEHYKQISGDTTESIYSDAIAMSTAEYYLWYYARMNDTITITSKTIIPFLDVNQKIKYRLQKTKEVYEYITKNISLSISSGELDMTITAQRYYDLYPDLTS